MYIILILFFVSLASIIFMIGRKLVLVKGGHVAETEHSHIFVPDIEKIKQVTTVHAKKYGYAALVTTLRLYIKSSNILKDKYNKLRTKIKERRNRNKGDAEIILEEQKANKFLKMISDYKHKIREIKHKIKREEDK
ncbi:MAG TPA: hypothetical protein VJC14_02135 [Candidatus Paceibacterota bacterium]